FAKLLLVLAMASLGAATRFRVLPILGADVGSSRDGVERLVRYVAYEAGGALLVFGCPALLTESTPPHHEADVRQSSPPAGARGGRGGGCRGRSGRLRRSRAASPR